MFYGKKIQLEVRTGFMGEATHLREENANINMVSTDFPAHSEDKTTFDWINSPFLLLEPTSIS